MSARNGIVRGLVVVAVLFGARVASASPDYPQLLQEELDMPCAPSCTLCHDDITGGNGTVHKPFGKMIMDGPPNLHGEKEEHLPTAVERYSKLPVHPACSGEDPNAVQPKPGEGPPPECDGQPPVDICDPATYLNGDADCDGVHDIVELRGGFDPNIAGPGDLCRVKYGCGARVEPKGRIDATALLAAGALAAALGFWRRRRSAG